MADSYPDKISSEVEGVHLPLPKFQHFKCSRDGTESDNFKAMDACVFAHPGQVKVTMLPACGQLFLSNSGGEHICGSRRGHAGRRHSCEVKGHDCFEADGELEKRKNASMLEILRAFQEEWDSHDRGSGSQLGMTIKASRLSVEILWGEEKKGKAA